MVPEEHIDFAKQLWTNFIHAYKGESECLI